MPVDGYNVGTGTEYDSRSSIELRGRSLTCCLCAAALPTSRVSLQYRCLVCHPYVYCAPCAAVVAVATCRRHCRLAMTWRSWRRTARPAFAR